MSSVPANRQWPLADYKPVLDPAEADNPYIAALPPIWTQEEVSIGLTRYLGRFALPPDTPVQIRINKLQQIREYYQPSLRDKDLLFDIVSHIRAGYLNRNPIGPNFVATLKRGIAAVAASRSMPVSDPAGVGMLVLGVSGVGKSSSVRVVMDCFPQVIRHENYEGQQFYCHQVVWLKLNCPKKGGVVKLCKSFVESLDVLLRETYARKFAIRRGSSDDLELAMASLAMVHGLGLLVIDEIQNLQLATARDRDVTLAFLTSLMNGLGVPILFIGTNGARVLIEESFPTTRRTAGSVHSYNRLKQGRAFEFFMTELWKYQLVEVPVDLDDGWLMLFYKYSQGVPDIAVRLFVETQRRALSRSKAGVPSTMDPRQVDAVWNDRFKLMHSHVARAEQGMDPLEPGFGDDLQRLSRTLDRVGNTSTTERTSHISREPNLSDGHSIRTSEAGDAGQIARLAEKAPKREEASERSRTAYAKRLGAAATPEQLAAAAARPARSKLAEIVRSGGEQGLSPHEAIRNSGRRSSSKRGAGL